MSTHSNNIRIWLEKEKASEQVVEFLKSNPNHSLTIRNIELRGDDSLDRFNYIKVVLLESIKTGVFEELSSNIQNNIGSIVQTIIHNQNDVDHFIQSVDKLNTTIIHSNLDFRLKSFDKFYYPLKEISSLKRKYNITETLQNLKVKLDTIESIFSDSKKIFKEVKSNKQGFEEELKNAKDLLSSSKSLFEQIKQYSQEVENSKKEIVSFKSNIESFKADISNSTKASNEIIMQFENKRDEVDDLIRQSEKALSLKSTIGISAAISEQYKKEDNKWRKNQWLIASGTFISIALFGILLLIFEVDLFGKSVAIDSINAILARVVFIGVAITAATFCAKQYLHQKKLADNYAYKLVIAKSILAFAQEIKKHDPGKAITYIENAMNEINKSPFSEKEGSTGIDDKHISLFEKMSKIFDKFSSSK